MKGQGAELEWTEDGVPVSRRFDDPYYSFADGLGETRHVFLHGNELPARFADRAQHHVAELGFGTGLTLAMMRHAYRRSRRSGPLRFTSFEAYPMASDQMRSALAKFPEVAAEIDDVLEALANGETQLTTPDLEFRLILGDAREMLPNWEELADSWCLDGFSPAKNPELWDPDLLREVARCTRSGGRFATYTAAGYVRRALSEAGFNVSRVTGYGRKRHMTVGVKP